jgi:hypothetical protein
VHICPRSGILAIIEFFQEVTEKKLEEGPARTAFDALFKLRRITDRKSTLTTALIAIRNANSLSVMFHISELADQVIDHLHADAESLRTCALVSRSWVPAARYHIFFSVNIKKNSTCRFLCDIIAQSPDIGGYIRNIYIYFQATRPPFTSLLDLHVPQPRRLTIVNCPHTEELALICHLIDLPSVTHIRFFSGTSVSRAQLDYLAQNRTTKLDSLLLYSASDTPADQVKESVSFIIPLHISALNVSGDATLVTSILVDPRGPINLRKIDALTFGAHEGPCLQRLINICGEDLVVLEILVSTGHYLRFPWVLSADYSPQHHWRLTSTSATPGFPS